MHNSHLRTIIALGTLVLIALFCIQAYWFHRAFDVAEQQFDHSVQVAMRRVADSVSNAASIKKIASNFFLIETENALDGEDVDRMLETEFAIRNLVVDYELGVYDADDDTLLYGNYVKATRPRTAVTSAAHGHSGVATNFAVYFPEKNGTVLASLDIWVWSTVALLLMTGFFAYAIVSLLRERKFASLKNDFVNNMTHEFRTPVTNIGIAGEILRNKLPHDHELSNYVRILLQENDLLRGKIDQVLLGSSAGHVQRESFTLVDVHRLLTECAAAFELRLVRREGQIELALHADRPSVCGDRELLAQAFRNVVDNAEKYTGTAPRILVTTRDTVDGVVIEITDNGIGVPPAMRSKVFEKFYRVPAGDVHNVKGFGLGLSFVKEVIKSHRGSVSIAGASQGGTTVQIFLPA